MVDSIRVWTVIAIIEDGRQVVSTDIRTAMQAEGCMDRMNREGLGGKKVIEFICVESGPGGSNITQFKIDR